MNQSNATQPAVVERIVAERLSAATDIHDAYIGLDVHKDSIAVSIAEPGRHEPEFRGEWRVNLDEKPLAPGAPCWRPLYGNPAACSASQ